MCQPRSIALPVRSGDSNLNCTINKKRNAFVCDEDPNSRPAWYLTYLVISSGTHHVLPLIQPVWKWLAANKPPPLYLLSPQKGLCEECREFN